MVLIRASAVQLFLDCLDPKSSRFAETSLIYVLHSVISQGLES